MAEPDAPGEQGPNDKRDPEFTRKPDHSDLRASNPNDNLDSTIDTEAGLQRDGIPHSPTLEDAVQISWDDQAYAPPSKIGRYILLEKLGSGTYGVVHRARDEVLGRFVALKLLTRFERESEVDAWLSEARVLASLDHPAIVPVFDVGKTDTGQPYIVSKLLSGGTLNKRVARQGCTVEEAVRTALQLADALDYLHHQGVMHRDIKPSNILTTPDAIRFLLISVWRSMKRAMEKGLDSLERRPT